MALERLANETDEEYARRQQAYELGQRERDAAERASSGMGIGSLVTMAIVAVIGALTGGALLQNPRIREWMEENAGMEGMALANMLTGFLGGEQFSLDAMLSERAVGNDELRGYITTAFGEGALPPELVNELVEHRDLLVDIIETSGLSLMDMRDTEKASEALLSAEVLQLIMTDARYAPLVAAAFPVETSRPAIEQMHREGAFAELNFTALAGRLRGGDVALADVLREELTELLSTEQLGAILNGAALQEALNDKALLSQLLTTYIADEQTRTQTVDMLFDNRRQIEAIFARDGGFDVLASVIVETQSVPDLANLPELLQKPEYKELADYLVAQIRSGNHVEEALQALNFASLIQEGMSADERRVMQDTIQAATLGTALLTAPSDVAEMSNLDVLVSAYDNPQLMEAAQNLLGMIGGAEGELTPQMREQIAQAGPELLVLLEQMDVDFLRDRPDLMQPIKDRLIETMDMPDSMKALLRNAPIENLIALIPAAQAGENGFMDTAVTDLATAQIATIAPAATPEVATETAAPARQ
jgi:hypothetical protein